MDIEQQYDKLLRYCYMKLKNKALAEDITQETFIRFFESTNYQNTGKEMAYLYTTARNLCTDHFRKRKEDLMEDIPDKMQEMFTAKDEMRAVVNRVSIEQALEQLEENEREIVVLRFLTELSISDIGKTMGISRFAVRRRISAALDKLRRELAENEEF